MLAERLRQWLASDPMLSEHKITGSFGVATFPTHGFSIEDLIRVADAGMYVSKRSGGNLVSTAQEFAESQDFARQRQQISAYIEGFLQREDTGPEHLDELIATLRKLCGTEEGCNVTLLKESIEALSRAAESRELRTAGHGDLVARYSETIARALGLPGDEIAELVYAARVHDVGKIWSPNASSTKPARSPMPNFATYAPTLASGRKSFLPSRTAPRCVWRSKHHQHFDGTGYPGGLRGEQIPLGQESSA